MNIKKNSRKKLTVVNTNLEADGVFVYLDEYDTKEEALQALGEAVLQYADWGIEVEEE